MRLCYIFLLLLIMAVMPFHPSSLKAHAASAQKGGNVVGLELLVDPSQSLTVHDVAVGAMENEFSPVRGNSINLGFRRTAAWVRLTLPSDKERPLLLSLSPNFIDELDVYILAENDNSGSAVMTHYRMGDHRPLRDDDLSGLDNVVPIDLAADEEARIYIRASAVNSSLTLTVSLYSPADHTIRTTILGLASGTWFGGMGVLLVIQLVFFYYDRKPYFILLAFATFMAMLVYMGTLGLSRLFLFPEGGIGNDMFTAASSWFGLTASALASASILDLPRRAPWLNRIFLLERISSVSNRQGFPKERKSDSSCWLE
ncbi:7TM-DISM domain-containing protein [Telmatospirillum sp. J64-1]|uniref:7TMR-DISMED2 domain-containing protein n=1 Tax=Telmatospirillum sp. J64-1 TaxID=2502183 RepID=UPI00115CD4D3|nr:7TM-DISM domain-containing protein [Telmatospirillum sp. J64-1]